VRTVLPGSCDEYRYPGSGFIAQRGNDFTVCEVRANRLDDGGIQILIVAARGPVQPFERDRDGV
tara:strand:+ start:477 stop:668 length:192 start_codon:yes stop_codon:yes gene_type:complete